MADNLKERVPKEFHSTGYSMRATMLDTGDTSESVPVTNGVK